MKIQKWQNATNRNTSLDQYIQMVKDQLEGYLSEDELWNVKLAYKMGTTAFDAAS